MGEAAEGDADGGADSGGGRVVPLARASWPAVIVPVHGRLDGEHLSGVEAVDVAVGELDGQQPVRGRVRERVWVRHACFVEE